MNEVKKTIKKILNPDEKKRIDKWKSKFDTSKASYDGLIDEMQKLEDMYNGSKKIYSSTGTRTKKDANSVRNITYELIESQTDPSVPYPKVIPKNEEDLLLAKGIEKAIGNMIKELKLVVMNDLSERTVPIKGGDFYLIEWDNTYRTHTNVGRVSITEIDPRNFIPQPGVIEIENMDYFFLRSAQTKDYVKRKYGVIVELAEEEDITVRGNDATSETSDLVTITTVYYKNGGNKIGKYVWCDDYELYDNDDYQCREIEVCAKCGLPKRDDECECGSKKFKKEKLKTEQIFTRTEFADGIIEPQVPVETEMMDELGNPILDENGYPMMFTSYEWEEVPYYQAGCYPIVLRKNVSEKNKLLGKSDVSVIWDQQQNVNKIVSKINEKIFKGGSFVTVPRNVGINTNGEELNVIEIDNPADVSMINVINVQPNMNNDITMQEYNYQWAKSELGITDSYQGKQDTSARSGTAKQYAINQAAGRLESKRTMKSEAFAKVYELMFKTWLAYSDEPLTYSEKDSDGNDIFGKIDRFKFLKQDNNGMYYWNDEFIFETDPTTTLMENREAMWQQAAQMLQSGAFGPLGELSTIKLYWTFMEKHGYPNAAFIKQDIDERIQKMTEGGMSNVDIVSSLQNSGKNFIQ